MKAMNNWHYEYFGLFQMELRNLDHDGKIFEMFTGAERQRWLGNTAPPLSNPRSGMHNLRERVMPISEANLNNCPSKVLNSTLKPLPMPMDSDFDGDKNDQVASNEKQRLPSPKSTHSCTKCDAEFVTVGKLNLHIKNFHGTEIISEFVCECGATFNDRKGLRSHQRRKEKKKVDGLLQCEVCKKELQTQRGFENHVTKCKAAEESRKSWNCSECRKTYKTLRGYENHMKCHSSQDNEL